MNFDFNHYLKWIHSSHPLVAGKKITLTQTFVLMMSEDSVNLGFVALKLDMLNDDFFNRFDQRQMKIQSENKEYTLYHPCQLDKIPDHIRIQLMARHIKFVYSPILFITHANHSFFIKTFIRVVNVDDSPVILKLLKTLMDEFGFIQVVKQTTNPHEALDIIKSTNPDIVTLDIQMPGKNGVEVLSELLDIKSLPVLMISSLNPDEGSLVFDALNQGAFDYIQKPSLDNRDLFKEELKEKIISAIQSPTLQKHIKITQSEFKYKKSLDTNTNNSRTLKLNTNIGNYSFPTQLIWCLGSSTGGTQALTTIFTSLPSHIPPTLIVQHIPPVFSKAFADSLNQLVPFTVKEAKDGDIVLCDHVYIAPGGFQMGVRELNGKLYIQIHDTDPINRFKPSVDFLFKDVSKLKSFKVIAGLLTGMGRDGAQGLLELKNKGAWTFAQNEKSSIVYGMPRAAHELGATNASLDLSEISQYLLTSHSNFQLKSKMS